MNIPVYIGEQSIEALGQFSVQKGFKRFVLVADQNTYTALGERVAVTLEQHGFNLTTIMLRGEEIVANEHYLLQALAQSPVEEQVFLAVGSGTITDITRFVSYHTRSPFLSLPTAPSVDGFTSIGAPLILNGVKQTLNAHAPLAIFADLPTLQAAPKSLIAAGFGDMIGKITALADWKLGHLLWDEPYDAAVAERARKAVENCLTHVDEIATGNENGIRLLIEGLIESGFCMLQVGNSRPASGAEHHCSHYWEMMLLKEKRPALLHGAKVGFATTLIAERYQQLRALNLEDVIEKVTMLNREREIKSIREGFGDGAEDVVREQSRFLNMTDAELNQLKQRIIDCWDEIHEIALTVRTADEIQGLLRKVNAPTTAAELNLSGYEVKNALRYGHYLRNRFTVVKLLHLLNGATS